MLAGEYVPRDRTYLVETLDRNDLFVGSDLKNGIRRSVNYRLTGANVFLTQLLYDLGARCRDVPENSWYLRPLNKLVDDHRRETIGISRKCLFKDDAGHFPVTGRRVLTIRQ